MGRYVYMYVHKLLLMVLGDDFVYL